MQKLAAIGITLAPTAPTSFRSGRPPAPGIAHSPSEVGGSPRRAGVARPGFWSGYKRRQQNPADQQTPRRLYPGQVPGKSVMTDAESPRPYSATPPTQLQPPGKPGFWVSAEGPPEAFFSLLSFPRPRLTAPDPAHRATTGLAATTTHTRPWPP